MALFLLTLVPAAMAMPDADGGEGAAKSTVGRIDNRPDLLGTKQAALKQSALEKKLHGKKSGTTVQVADGQFVELGRTGTDAIWTVLGQFADMPHNEIAQPNRTYNNSTIWEPDFSRDYFLDLLFDESEGANSMSNWFIEQSSGRYSVTGDVTDWVTVPGSAAGYDDDLILPSGDNAVWQFLTDSVDGWYASQLAAHKTRKQIDKYLSQFDTWDRYDFDGDGNFNEPDGYIDHFQSLHAGEGNEAGGGVLGDSAIWSHSWYAYYTDYGTTGPKGNLAGGVQVGDSKYWIGDYTIQPENGGVGVFTHEFSHDLGLPDLYDTNGGENGTGFWTNMSSGSWLSDGTTDIGSMAGHLGAWEKFQLGWLNYTVATAGHWSEHALGPEEFNTTASQGLFVLLPDKNVTEYIAKPYAGTKFYYSGSGDNLRNTMYKSFTLTTGASLTAKVNYGIEEGYDYAYLVASTDGGKTWVNVPTNLSTTDTNGIDGFSSGWVDLTADLAAFSGSVMLGFQYVTDGGVAEIGFSVDDIQITGSTLDGAEVDAGWTLDGFRVTTGTESNTYRQYYVAESKTYWGYDSTLKVGPYNFGFLNDPALGNYVERFPYQDGMLVSYWDTSQKDNNTSVHPGKGMLLPVDAHPKAMMRPTGAPWRNRVQTYDATFGFEPTDPITLHFYGKPSVQRSLPAVPVFNDLNSYYDSKNPRGSVIVPATGTQIKIVGISPTGQFMRVVVSPVQ